LLVIKGDIGIIAMESKKNQRILKKPKPLTIMGVYKTFHQIALIDGNKSQAKKISKIQELIVNSIGYESLYIIRSLQGMILYF
jgi:DNA ligase 1